MNILKKVMLCSVITVAVVHASETEPKITNKSGCDIKVVGYSVWLKDDTTYTTTEYPPQTMCDKSQLPSGRYDVIKIIGGLNSYCIKNISNVDIFSRGITTWNILAPGWQSNQKILGELYARKSLKKHGKSAL